MIQKTGYRLKADEFVEHLKEVGQVAYGDTPAFHEKHGGKVAYVLKDGNLMLRGVLHKESLQRFITWAINIYELDDRPESLEL